ncbi:hypothetical protein DFH09DRAFT_256168 [Mycena vulgaris]|nr:hypothetical protein DFH09DRAFT_256168 [Mycena vulgaris]
MYSQPNEDYSSPMAPKTHRRRRTMSTVSIPSVRSESKILLAAGMAPLGPRSTDQQVAVGAFTLTGCARTSLRCFAPGPLALRADLYEEHGYMDPAVRPPMPCDSPPASPACSFDSIPSFSRTASPFSESEGMRALLPPGWGARGKEMERARAQPQRKAQIHPVLETLERDSRVGTGRVVCAACMKQGTNFPRCKHCSQMWCSRECRLSSVHRCGARHSGQA